MKTLQNAIEILERHEIRPSVQRTEVVKYLIEHRCHPTADDIFMALSPEMPTLSRTTIYNVLKTLEENGAVRAIVIDEKNVRYDICVDDHAHFKCSRCGRIFDIEMPRMERQLPEGFEMENVDVYYYGICPECASKQ
ncbi:MAG: transcriptional repressor [Paludibacteraceae bacterium]|nr:transcriptional repressor [Paludibacteraceae bacterium]